MFEQSEQIADLAAALAIAQGRIGAAVKDRENPHFRSTYATLASVRDACRAPLSENGIAVFQIPTERENVAFLVTRLVHKSGQWIESVIRLVPSKAGPQAFGSELTYACRYGLAALVGIPSVDDDGNAAEEQAADESRRPPPRAAAVPTPQEVEIPFADPNDAWADVAREATIAIGEATTVDAIDAILAAQGTVLPEPHGSALRRTAVRRVIAIAAAAKDPRMFSRVLDLTKGVPCTEEWKAETTRLYRAAKQAVAS
jgi:hypothetical protein